MKFQTRYVVMTATGSLQPEAYESRDDALREAMTFANQGGAGVLPLMIPTGEEGENEADVPPDNYTIDGRSYDQWTVAELKTELEKRGESTEGNKPELFERLAESD